MKTDCLVLGAGMVGISAAIHLQKRGRSVALVDRRGPAEETSYGNAGLIQREGVVPYMFPREWKMILQHALNRGTDSHYHLSALPRIAPYLFKYWAASTPAGKAQSTKALAKLVEHCLSEHEALMQAAGITGMIRRTGYIRASRSQAKLDAGRAEDEAIRREYGITAVSLDAKAIAELEPHLKNGFAGGVHMTDPVSVADPGAVGRAYAELFTKLGGRLIEGEARTLQQTSEGHWRVATRTGWAEAPQAVVALGPWSDDITRPLGLRIPLGWKRGYHMHYRTEGNATLGRPVIDSDYGYCITPMMQGIRLTTGAEFANRDAPPTPVQLDRVEPKVRDIFPLGARIDAQPWLGRRPCLPDMLPAIGPVPGKKGLWLDFGHHHLGFTLGPVSGRLLAEMMTGEVPLVDPAPYRTDRF
ncbi:MAG: NAD(P)/FAD-dependent oxidoreductase [Hyphomicrobiaceae bacterium]